MRLRIAAALLFIPIAAAHVPTFNEAGTSPGTAFQVENPTKSWVFYDTLAGGQHWFRLHMQEGETIVSSLSLPANEEGRPALWILGPGLEGHGPNGTPPGMGGIRAEAQDVLSIEPFTPLAMRATAEWRGQAPTTGTYYVVVEGQADYALAIGGRESFTPWEWITVPVERVAIQQWSGVAWPLAIVGEGIGVTAAAVYARRRQVAGPQSIGLLGAGAIAGTGFTTALLATIAAAHAGPSTALLVPALFAGMALAVGYGASRSVRGEPRWGSTLLWALAALVAWAGLIVGPIALAGSAAWRKWQGRAA